MNNIDYNFKDRFDSKILGVRFVFLYVIVCYHMKRIAYGL